MATPAEQWIQEGLARGETYHPSRVSRLRRKHRLKGCAKAGEGGNDG